MRTARWLALSGALFSLSAIADINVGVTLSATGPAASLGIPEKNSFALVPTTIAGHKINYIILDDGSDTTTAVTNARKLISKTIDVGVTSVLQTTAGKMIFARFDERSHTVYDKERERPQREAAGGGG